MNRLITLSLLLTLTACGKVGQHPVASSDLEQMRANGKAEIGKGKEQPQVIHEQVVVVKPTEVFREQATVNANAIVINPESNVRFIEGQPGQLTIRAFSTVKDVKTKLVAKNLPEGAVLTESITEANVYTLSWTPALGSVPLRDVLKIQNMKVTLNVVKAPTENLRQSLEGLVREKEFSVLVLHDQTAPSELKINELANDVNEDTLVPFSITVKVPGIDGDSLQKPRLEVSYDGGVLNNTRDYLELDGRRHVILDPQKKEAEYLGQATWKFSRVFDTKNIGVLPELSVKGELRPQAEASHVRLSFKVISPLNTSTPESLKQMRIVHKKAVAPSSNIENLEFDP